MKRFTAFILASLLACVPVTAFADDADLEARVAALEEKVAALEAQLSGSAPEGVAAASDQEVADVDDVETGITADGCSLEYVDYEVTKSYDDADCVVLYFDFINGSGETKNAMATFVVDVFQNGKEQDFAIVSDNEAMDDNSTDLRSGADPLRVAFGAKLEDMSDIIVSIHPMSRSVDPVEFTVTLE
ncbi:MAG: DUF5067 domain-containing protein [Lachnospiraceae bacterium]|nr:DUF5067 domain-containing protein [Lachnospiraceae bacterium]